MTIDEDIYNRGLGMRRKVLGEEYVHRAQERRRLQPRLPAHRHPVLLGRGLGDTTLTPRERSILISA